MIELQKITNKLFEQNFCQACNKPLLKDTFKLKVSCITCHYYFRANYGSHALRACGLYISAERYVIDWFFSSNIVKYRRFSSPLSLKVNWFDPNVEDFRKNYFNLKLAQIF